MFRRKEVEEAIKIPARRIQFYSDSGLLRLKEANPGRGRERQYSPQNVLELLVIKELGKHKIELSEIQRIMTKLSGEIDKILRDPSGYFIYIYGNGDVTYGSERQRNSVTVDMRNHSSVTIINFNNLAIEGLEALGRITKERQ